MQEGTSGDAKPLKRLGGAMRKRASKKERKKAFNKLKKEMEGSCFGSHILNRPILEIAFPEEHIISRGSLSHGIK